MFYSFIKSKYLKQHVKMHEPKKGRSSTTVNCIKAHKKTHCDIILPNSRGGGREIGK